MGRVGSGWVWWIRVGSVRFFLVRFVTVRVGSGRVVSSRLGSSRVGSVSYQICRLWLKTEILFSFFQFYNMSMIIFLRVKLFNFSFMVINALLFFTSIYNLLFLKILFRIFNSFFNVFFFLGGFYQIKIELARLSCIPNDIFLVFCCISSIVSSVIVKDICRIIAPSILTEILFPNLSVKIDYNVYPIYTD